MKSILQVTDLSTESSKSLSTFLEKYHIRWSAASRNKDRFEKKNCDWLYTEVEFSSLANQAKPNPTTPSSKGRPSTEFIDSSEQSKRRKTKELRLDRSTEELAYAAQMKFRAEGKLNEAEVIKNVAFSTPTRASKYKESLKKESEVPFSADDALSLFVEAKLTKFQYNLIRSSAKSHKSILYPNYESITAAKKGAIQKTYKFQKTSLKCLFKV